MLDLFCIQSVLVFSGEESKGKQKLTHTHMVTQKQDKVKVNTAI